MKVKITRIDTTLPLPQYQTPGSAAFDLYSRIDMTIEPKTLAVIPTNLIIQTPEGYALIVAARSSLPKKKGLLIPHGFGLIDRDYAGPADEVLIQLYNFTDQPAQIIRGERIAQAFFIPNQTVTFEETDPLKDSRGGYGSTGI